MSPIHTSTSAKISATSKENVTTENTVELLDEDIEIKDTMDKKDETNSPLPPPAPPKSATPDVSSSSGIDKPDSSKSGHETSPPLTLPPVPTGPGQQWSPNHIALPQFLELCNLFMGETPEE